MQHVLHASNDAVHVAYETLGPPGGDPLLLVAGTGVQMVWWHDAFCATLNDRGFTVARFDNRDAGLSTHLSAAGVPNPVAMLRRPAG